MTPAQLEYAALVHQRVQGTDGGAPHRASAGPEQGSIADLAYLAGLPYRPA